jgi:hypothetical protein
MGCVRKSESAPWGARAGSHRLYHSWLHDLGQSFDFLPPYPHLWNGDNYNDSNNHKWRLPFSQRCCQPVAEGAR